MSQSDDKADGKPIPPDDRVLREDEQPKKETARADLSRENRDLKSKVRGLEAVNQRLKDEIAELKAELANPAKSRRITEVPGAGTPISCIDDIGEE